MKKNKLIVILMAVCLLLPAAKAQDDLISVNFQNADINQVIKVLGDITETIIIPHEDLQGKVTILSMDKVETKVVANVLESALMTKGFTLVRSGAALKIVPLPETKQTNVAVNIGTSPDGIEEEDIVITQVMPLSYASALKLKTILQPLVGKHGNILANEVTNTLIITDLSSNIKRLATIISQMEKRRPAKIQVKTFVLNYGDAKKVAEILNSLSKDQKDVPYPRSIAVLEEGKPLEIFGQIEAFAEEETNSIVVASAPVNFASIESLINKLDVFPPQAMIEVIIMDVTLDDDFAMGVEFAHPTSSTSTTEGAQLDLGGSSDWRESIFHSLLGLGTDAATSGFTYRLLDEKETLNLLFFILSTQENTKFISTPRIMASNNQESIISVGQEVPIIESSVTDIVNNITTVNFKYEDIGLKLQVTPRISQDDYVNLKVHAEVKDLSPQTLFDASIINIREADATVIIPDGHTAVLGGLIRDNNSVIEHKVPLLGDIPFLGVLFKKTETTLYKTELLIFLTPRIIKDTKDLDKLASSAEEKLRLLKKAQSSREVKKAVGKVVGQSEKDKKKLHTERAVDTIVGPAATVGQK